MVVEAGGSIAIHSPALLTPFLNNSGADAICLNIHAPDGGFAEFMRGLCDAVAAKWDQHPVP